MQRKVWDEGESSQRTHFQLNSEFGAVAIRFPTLLNFWFFPNLDTWWRHRGACLKYASHLKPGLTSLSPAQRLPPLLNGGHHLIHCLNIYSPAPRLLKVAGLRLHS